ncbi:MAG: hypothetical protein ABW252_04005 [Polyangiales bacterium]
MLSGSILLGAGCAEPSEDAAQGEAPEVAAQFFAKATAAPFGCEGTRVALQTRNGKNYLTAVAGGGFGVAANATKIDRFEKFKVYDMGFNRIALQAPNGRYVGWGAGQQNRSQQQNGQANVADFLLSANSFAADNSTVFRVSRPKDSEWLYVQTTDGRFISAANGGGGLVSVAWPFPGENQQLKAVCVDAPDEAPSDDSSDDPSDGPSDDSGWDDDSSGDPSDWDDVSSGRPGLGG